MPPVVTGPSTTTYVPQTPTATTGPVTPGTTGTAGTTGTTGTTATTATTGVNNVTANTVAAGGGFVPPVAAENLPPKRAVINGFGGTPLPTVNITLNPTPGQVGATEAKTLPDSTGWTSRGYIDVAYQPAVGGVNIDVESHHSKPNDPATYQGDEMVMYLQARVLDNGKERVITLSTLMDGIGNPQKGPVGKQRFFVNYDDINKWLQSKNPNLKFAPGDPLAVYAVWKKAGHQWGGFCRGGYFDSPQALGKQNVLNIRTGAATGPAPAARSTEYVDKPIDITLKVPDALVSQYNLVLDKDAKYVSRREHEQKFCPKDVPQLAGTVKNLLGLCTGDPKKMEDWLLGVFGKDEALSKQAGHAVSGWHLSTTDRYYAKNDDGTYKLGKDGLPVVVPMVDAYQDNPNSYSGAFPIARANMAARFRDGEIKSGESVGSMGKLNMKTTRVCDPFTLTQTGLEISLDTKYGLSNNPAALTQLADLLNNAPAPYSPLPELKKTAYNLNGTDVTQVAVVNMANRYKFTLEHENGMELEVSMDVVHAGIACKTATPSQTKGMTEDQKFDYYAGLFDKNDAVVARSGQSRKAGAGEKNQVVFEDGPSLVMAQLWVDAQGAKHVSEHPCVRFPQSEIEMDHVQARTTGPVQSGYNRPTETTTITNDADQETFLKAVSDKVTMNGPPMTHSYEDLKQPQLYASHNYVQMQDCVSKFRTAIFPNGVNPARQKAAQALELAGLIPKETFNLSASFTCNGGGVNISSWGTPTNVTLSGDKVSGPGEVAVDFNGFPVRIPFTGTETAKELAEKVQSTLDKAVLYKATLSETKDSYGKLSYKVVIEPRAQG